MTVTEAVLQSDLERNMLLEREKVILAKMEAAGDIVSTTATTASTDADTASVSTTSSSSIPDVSTLSIEEKRKKILSKNTTTDDNSNEGMIKDLKELDSLYARLQVLSADSAESRAAMILSGLQFTTSMQSSPISSLSGGWRMRVALAAALFIEPDLLMLYVHNFHFFFNIPRDSIVILFWINDFWTFYPKKIMRCFLHSFPFLSLLYNFVSFQ
jgi:ABC transporter